MADKKRGRPRKQKVIEQPKVEYYFNPEQRQGESYQDYLIRRIGECEAIVDGIGNSFPWQVIIKDVEDLKNTIDFGWQELAEEQLDRARVVKFATNHILSLPMKYKEELDGRKKELQTLQNPTKEITQDYDTE